MKLIKNTGNDRVIDLMRNKLSENTALDIVSPAFSLFAFGELKELLCRLDSCRMVLPSAEINDLGLTGHADDRIFRNRLQTRWLARDCIKWVENCVNIRHATSPIPQSTIIIGKSTKPQLALTGACPITTEGLGIAAGNQFSIIQVSDLPQDTDTLYSWFNNLWGSLSEENTNHNTLKESLHELAEPKAPSLVYYLTLFKIFNDNGDQLNEEHIVKSATGIRNTVVWKKLFKFQKDGVIGAIDKLERFGGCIIADSVGLGKTFEALAIIKYYELRNDRVLVLTPKRLRDNWTLYKANDRRNFLAPDRFNYDVLNHTDLSRDNGLSGDIDISHINWGNYDLVVIDESHNFRNKATHVDRETRYDRLMRRIIQEGVKTRVLMLSATPVNNRLADLKNQIAFVTEGDDLALSAHGISSINATVNRAQLQFNRWLSLEENLRQPAKLVDMLGFDYFKLLDLLTIARSRKHIEKYYGTVETGCFPERLKPINIKADVDSNGEFPSIRVINDEIRRLNLAAYAPLRYVMPHKKAAYDKKYSTKVRGGESFFYQIDREESLVHLLRVNVLKRMESSVTSFALTLERQLTDIKATLGKIEAHEESFDEVDIADIDVDDPAFESLLVGSKVKVLLKDVDLIRWKQDLIEDRNRIATLLSAARQINAARDIKLQTLKDVIKQKCRRPINDDNAKLIVFTAFADTARYLYKEISQWAFDELNLHSALVTGTGYNKATLQNIRKDFSSIISAFSPCSKERPDDLVGEGEIDILIATDCISEGQNLQDCDTVINFDIHWNPVRIIQRFGRIDRIGSFNTRIQLINFWPNIELEEYINLEQRVSGRMVLLDISATGEENIIEYKAGNQMNDLEYRRKQLLKLQDAVIDLEDLSSGVSITDLTLNDFRVDLADYLKEYSGKLENLALGTMAITTLQDIEEPGVKPGIFFCLRFVDQASRAMADSNYPLAPYYLVYVSNDGEVSIQFTQTKQALDMIKRLTIGRDFAEIGAYNRYDKDTKYGQDMNEAQKLLAKAVASIVGKSEESAIASLFTPGGTHANKREFSGINDFEVVAYLVVLPDYKDK